ncbi:bacillithiol biosynthesis cysteine-adding enzyme BshC [Metabacillus fastidiosus]|uniref:bacillithiol biosynthesis cysteine-adding enzyme BshC n=1 Tax=Metabacillus fastidiosus TaxID=1458 RepID=UPI000826A9EE|nr:bacillithiol biosynthesis cysteine-adding enzyme BshC [Metabacillus fastidiosus]MED4463317.1 bacillithiol biosynthesis cysteine-adding enzyme BshC [Metabacillus fastidiosus]
MEIVELSLKSSNTFVNDLHKNKLPNELFFSYNIHDENVYFKRIEDIKRRSFKRDQLVDYLKGYSERFAKRYPKMIENMERLRDPNSVVVIGGQQAGVLTGPLYTIHKVISILVLAREQEEKLNVPVIPVFWIAGEDHDFAEINHVFVSENKLIKKRAMKHELDYLKKLPVSDIQINDRTFVNWTKEIIETYGETDFTNRLLEQIEKCTSRADSFVQVFEELILEMFQDEGLVLINSGDHRLRELEKNCFFEIIEKNSAVGQAVQKKQDCMREYGYKPIIEMKEESANLFYHHDGERYLMDRCSENEFKVEDLGLVFSKEELIKLVTESPERFSNNVVTRPLMQEFLFPTLAFIAGPGEITYWAELKEVFSLFGYEMPPVVPRLNITILERSIERDMKELDISLEEVLERGTEGAREAYLHAHTPVEMKPLVDGAKKEIGAIHRQLKQAALTIDPSLEPLLQKNAFLIENQLDFLTKVVDRRVKEQNEVELSKYRRIENALKPNGQLQERIWNIYYFLNKFGTDFVVELTNLSYTFNDRHKIVKI